LGLEYLLVPAWFAETFIIDHANATSWHAQKHRLLELDSLRSVVASLQDSVTRRYIAQLNKPRIKLPSVVGFVGAVGVGFVVGRVTR